MISLRLLILSTIFPLLLINCKNSTSKNNLSQNKSTQDTLVKNQFLFSDPQQSNDTFRIINQSWYYYFCFGKFKNPELLTNYFSSNYSIKTEITEVYNNPSLKDTLYRISRNRSFIKYAYENSDEFEEVMNIVSGKITTPDFVMTNGIKIGIEKEKVLRMIFGENIPERVEKFDNIEIITALTGLWINFKFSEDILSEINIVSDMQVDKE